MLAAAASNVAVDNLVERVVAANPKLRVVRVGHPARLLPAVVGSSLEAHVLASDNSSLAKDCRREMKAATSRLSKLGRKVVPLLLAVTCFLARLLLAYLVACCGLVFCSLPASLLQNC